MRKKHQASDRAHYGHQVAHSHQLTHEHFYAAEYSKRDGHDHHGAHGFLYDHDHQMNLLPRDGSHAQKGQK